MLYNIFVGSCILGIGDYKIKISVNSENIQQCLSLYAKKHIQICL